MNTVVLSDLNDYQKSLLTRLAYLNIDFRRFQNFKINQKAIKISDLRMLLVKPSEPYLGCLHFPQLKRLTNVNTTNMELVEKLKDAGLGDLEIVDLANDKKSGFNGICFKDSEENIGFSFRGTDLKTFSSLAADALADIEAFLTNSTSQVDQAKELFKRYQSANGQNYIYGHSLGGFLAEHVYLQSYPNIANTFVINPLHINSKLLDNKQKIAAFNNPIKFSCFVTGGDYVSAINPAILFANNVNYVKNNNNSEQTCNNLWGNHLIETGEFDNGIFVECPKEDAFVGRTVDVVSDAIKIINKEKIKSFFIKSFLIARKWISSAKLYLKNVLKNKKQTEDVITDVADEYILSAFEEYLNPDNYRKPEEDTRSVAHQNGNTKSKEHIHSTGYEDEYPL